MQQEVDNHIEIKCIFCERDLQKHEMIRYRGAISCMDCAEKQKQGSKLTSKPFFYLAGIGCLIGIVNFIYFTFHGLIFLPGNETSYIQPLASYFAGMTITLGLISFGLYMITRENLRIAGIIGMLTALLAASTTALALFDFATMGPYFVLDSITYTKTLNYYPTTLATYSLFGLVAAIVILLHMSDFKTENVSIASASFFLLSASIVMTTWTWYLVGLIHAFTYVLTFAFFVTRERPFEEEPIQLL
ncbi:hypothetical protein E4H12_06585 [Candidatus Thorarchaeota archaeon]|nr:MAG: hypothetical protein E4H12_06585 [Candidatus Thorarchaeota archaeon]